jgi:hypothetical protein
MSESTATCPHCNGPLVRWRVPEGATWQEEYFLACFNDECPYYVEGWDWMMTQYNQSASYRYALNPRNGSSLLIPVWSASATREMIEENDEGGDA